jgi:hypothetical protein
MFSLDRFYQILHDNLISYFTNSKSLYFYPFGTYQQLHTIAYQRDHTIQLSHEHISDTDPWSRQSWRRGGERTYVHCWFYDQEPLFPETPMPESAKTDQKTSSLRHILIANSEKSEFKYELLKGRIYHQDWYYFFHGFAALDWYRDFQYLDSRSFEQFDKVFICFNHLISNYRSYRLHLIAHG